MAGRQLGETVRAICQATHRGAIIHSRSTNYLHSNFLQLFPPSIYFQTPSKRTWFLKFSKRGVSRQGLKGQNIWWFQNRIIAICFWCTKKLPWKSFTFSESVGQEKMKFEDWRDRCANREPCQEGGNGEELGDKIITLCYSSWAHLQGSWESDQGSDYIFWAVWTCV